MYRSEPEDVMLFESLSQSMNPRVADGAVWSVSQPNHDSAGMYGPRYLKLCPRRGRDWIFQLSVR